MQNSRQTLAKLESEVFPDEIYEGKRAGFAVLYGKIKRESFAVFDLVQKRASRSIESSGSRISEIRTITRRWL